jgi:hypothetical protein
MPGTLGMVATDGTVEVTDGTVVVVAVSVGTAGIAGCSEGTDDVGTAALGSAGMDDVVVVVAPVAQSGHGAEVSLKSSFTVAASSGGNPIPEPDTVAPVAPTAA